MSRFTVPQRRARGSDLNIGHAATIQDIRTPTIYMLSLSGGGPAANGLGYYAGPGTLLIGDRVLVTKRMEAGMWQIEALTLQEGGTTSPPLTTAHADTAGQTVDDHHDQTHTIVSHDTTATGAELDELTDGSTTTLHDHAGGGVANPLELGTDDDDPGILRLFGGAAGETGGILEIFGSEDDDTEVQFWSITTGAGLYIAGSSDLLFQNDVGQTYMAFVEDVGGASKVIGLQNGPGGATGVMLAFGAVNTGFYTIAGDVVMSRGGTAVMGWHLGGGNEFAAIHLAGTAANPSFARSNDTNTGIFWPTGDEMAFTTGGVQRGIFTNNGFGVEGDIDLQDGGTVTQITSITTPVTLDTHSGQITTFTAPAIAAGAEATFTVTNSTVAATDIVLVNVASQFTDGLVMAEVTDVSAGTFDITLTNLATAAVSAGAAVINFGVIGGSAT